MAEQEEEAKSDTQRQPSGDSAESSETSGTSDTSEGFSATGEQTGAGEGDDEGWYSELPNSVRQRIEAIVPVLVRRTINAGLGAVINSEDKLRELGKDVPLPKELAGKVVNTASATKDELLKVFARETREFLQHVNLSEEIAKMLTMLSFEVRTEVRFIPNEERLGGVEPDVKAKVKVKRAGDASEGDGEADGNADHEEQDGKAAGKGAREGGVLRFGRRRRETKRP